MTVENRRVDLVGEDGVADRFPVGMRVLAVDDDPVCLKVLDSLLRKCQYKVTTTNQAIEALRMLRENRNEFDLVISDVNMPDMDGFKLLELVGLEMDLPVIMLSAHSDTRLVMKGVTHGACDYLLKPVRIEELKNIWQHVVRRKKLDSKDQNKFPGQDKAHHGTAEGEQRFSSGGNADDGKLLRKRKDQDEDEEDDAEENEHENDDPSTQKKPRVVWSVELHRKFVAAVNQLGLEKAVPKKILDLMNVEGLTRENVASHLQKYRLYLKRISSVATQQANMAAALGAKDPAYMRLGSLSGFGFAGAGRISNTAISSYTPGSMLSGFNSRPAGITSSGLMQQSTSQNLNYSIIPVQRLQPDVLPANHSAGLFQGVPTSLEISQLQQRTHQLNDASGLTVGPSFNGAVANITGSSNSISNASSIPLMLQGNTRDIDPSGAYGNPSSLRMASLNQESFDVGISGSNTSSHGQCNENWHGATQMPKFSSNAPMAITGTFPRNQMPSNCLAFPSAGPNIGSVQVGFSPATSVTNPLPNSRGDMNSQEIYVGNVVQAMSNTPGQRWEEQKLDNSQNISHSLGPMNPLVSGLGLVDPFAGLLNDSNPALGQQCAAGRPSIDPTLNFNGNKLLDQKSWDRFSPSNYDYFDDMMNARIKREQNEPVVIEGELGFDAYSLGSCI